MKGFEKDVFSSEQHRKYPNVSNNDQQQVKKYLTSILRYTADKEQMKQMVKTNDYGYACQVFNLLHGESLGTEREDLYVKLGQRKHKLAIEVAPETIYMQDQTDLMQTTLGENHYDRAYIDLLYEKERLGLIKPGDMLFETTSGSCGVAFASIATKLGFYPKVCIPAGGEKARENAIKSAGAELFLSDDELFVNGFPEFIKRYLKDNPSHEFIHHSAGNIFGRGEGINENVIRSMEGIITEAFQEREYDIVVSALGNGTNTLGVGRRLKEVAPETKLVGVETFTSASAYTAKYPGLFEEKFGIDPKKLHEIFGRNSIPGTSFPGLKFPALNESLQYVDDIILVADQGMIERYYEKTGKNLLELGVVQYDADSKYLGDYGRSTKASYEVAKSVTNEGKKALILGYDKKNRYDD